MPWKVESTRLVINVPIYCQPTTNARVPQSAPPGSVHDLPFSTSNPCFRLNIMQLKTLPFFGLFLMPCGKVCDDMNIITFFFKCSNHP